MAKFIQKSYTFTDLVVSTPINLGEPVEGQTIGFQLEGTGLSAADSDYAIYQSMDGVNWEAVSGAVVTNLADATAQLVSVRDLVTMQYLGFVMTSAGTETSGTLVLKLYIQ